MCLNNKILKIVCNFCTEICNLNKNHAHHGKKRPSHGVEDGYIFCKNYVACAPQVAEIIDTV